MKKINFEKIKSLKPKKIKFKKEKKIQEDLDLNKETKKVKTKRRKIRIGYYFLILLLVFYSLLRRLCISLIVHPYYLF